MKKTEPENSRSTVPLRSKSLRGSVSHFRASLSLVFWYYTSLADICRVSYNSQYHPHMLMFLFLCFLFAFMLRVLIQTGTVLFVFYGLFHLQFFHWVLVCCKLEKKCKGAFKCLQCGLGNLIHLVKIFFCPDLGRAQEQCGVRGPGQHIPRDPRAGEELAAADPVWFWLRSCHRLLGGFRGLWQAHGGQLATPATDVVCVQNLDYDYSSILIDCSGCVPYPNTTFIGCINIGCTVLT